MSTNAIIARKLPDGRFEGPDGNWIGRYHHWDGYPTGLGAELHKIATEVFGGDLRRMTKVLIDDHPAGWSNILDADWTREPGFGNNKAPECYCHGERSEPADLRIRADAPDCYEQYLYIIDEAAGTMGVFVTSPRSRDARQVATVQFDLPADWKAIEHKADNL